MPKINAEDVDIRNQPHEMWAEGACHDEPISSEIIQYLHNEGYSVANIDIWVDDMQGFWRWNCDIFPLRDHEMNETKAEYEEDLAKRQAEHLKGIYAQRDKDWKPCLHDQCPECIGTGIKKDGSACIHHISCSCPKCTHK